MDVIVLSETWVEERGWGRIESRLPRGYTWEKKHAKKTYRKGRAIGGMIME